MQDHIVASFGPDGVYTRHSEGAFLRLNDGRIVCIYSRFTVSGSDDAPGDLVATYSSDEGETWTEPVTCLPASLFNTHQVMSTSLMRMQNGDLGLFYLLKLAAGDERVYLSRSNDEGKTFYRHIECSKPDRIGYYVLNNDRVERLASGRILAPISYHRGSYSCTEEGHYFDARAFALFLYSDDDGETWEEAPDIIYGAMAHTRSGLQEIGAVERNSGVVWGYARTSDCYQYEFFSMDGGLHWTAAQKSRFTSPESPMKIKRHPETGDLYSVWNPIPNYNGRYLSKAGWGRTPIVWAVSKDDGATWSEPHIIEDGPEHGYCYPAIYFTNDGAMLVAYCAGGPEDDWSCLNRLSIKKIYI